ncbi:MAG: mechanosensitive ion channel family protein [Candidatus Schekmanbacteria bacterium]|nr:mechanosensitive ion channel family protein [Candidatus Schekmanbacteria bacterium]
MLLDRIYYGNSLQAWFIALLLVFVSMVMFRIFRGVILSRLTAYAKSTETQLDDMAVDILKKTKFFIFIFISIYIASLVVVLPPGVSKLIKSIAVTAFLIQVAVWGNAVITYGLSHYLKTKMGDDPAVMTSFGAIGFIARLFMWGIIVLMVLENLGVNITALIAGVGVGGIAIALAAQNILADLFASLSIMFDRPFLVGDSIMVGEHTGTVEHVGLKTTKIRSLSGEQIIISNTDLLKSHIRNYKRMFERRISFHLGVKYETPYEKLEKIPSLIEGIISKYENARFDRAHFKSYGDYALIFEIVYYVTDPDYNKYMDVQQNINLAIFSVFSQNGIEFAYPTQTIYMEGKKKEV